MMVFFTCKNLLVIVLQVYRLFVIYCNAEDDDENEQTEIQESRKNSSTGSLINLSHMSLDADEKKRENDQSEEAKEATQQDKNKLNSNKISNKIAPAALPPKNQPDQARRSWENNQLPTNDITEHPNSVSNGL